MSGRPATVESNDIFSNTDTGVVSSYKSSAIISNNRIRDGLNRGIFVRSGTSGTIHGNEIIANKGPGILVFKSTEAVFQNNKINYNGKAAIQVDEKGGGTFENNDLRNNKEGSWAIHPNSLVDVIRRNNWE